MSKKFVSWRRVSTRKQGGSGLGLEAQSEIIAFFVRACGGELIADYHEVYTGTELKGCIELRKAMDKAKAEKATLIIAKSDRFRNTVEALQVYDEMGDGQIMFCDLPHTDKFTITLFFALAEREALLASIRTKASLQVIKDEIAANGSYTAKNGRVITSLGNQGNNSVENLRKASTAAAVARAARAVENEHNVKFASCYEGWRELHGEITKDVPIEPFSEWIVRMGCKTSSGLEMTPIRCRAMLLSLQKQGIIKRQESETKTLFNQTMVQL